MSPTHSCTGDAPGPRQAVTAIELLLALVMVGVLLALAVPRVAAYGDRMAVQEAGAEITALFATARELAVARRSATSVRIDTVAGRVHVESGGAAVAASRNLRDLYGVRLTASRDSMAYDPRGLGHGAANLRVIASRGAAADTVFVSRLGRVRH